MKGSSTSDAGVFLASAITTAINQRVETRLVALDIKGAFDSVWWRGLLAHLWSISFRDKVFKLFQSYLSDRFVRVVTSQDSSDLYPVTPGVPQGAIWSPPLFNLCIRQLPTIVKHSLIVGYADDHTLLKIISDKSDRLTAASQLNDDLVAISQFGKIWQIKFAPNKTFSVLISLKRDLSSCPHPPLIMDDTIIPETSSIKVLGIKFDSLLTWEPHITDILSRAQHRAGQLYRCRSLLTEQDMSIIYKSWIRPILEYSNILYSGATATHLRHLNNLQSRIEQTCSSVFQPLLSCWNAAIVGLVCRLLAGEGRGNLQTYCPQFCDINQLPHRSHRLHFWDPAEHLRFVNPCNFKKFRRSWLVSAVTIWNDLPADVILQGETLGWRAILKDTQCCICN